jgi:hypothetical protein
MYEIAGRKIPSTLAEIVEPSQTALLIWDMEYAIGPNAFNYQDMLPKLKDLSALARRVGVRVSIRCRLALTWPKKKRECGCASG